MKQRDITEHRDLKPIDYGPDRRLDVFAVEVEGERPSANLRESVWLPTAPNTRENKLDVVELRWEEIPAAIKQLQEIYEMGRKGYTHTHEVLDLIRKHQPLSTTDLLEHFAKGDEGKVRRAIWDLRDDNKIEFDVRWHLIIHDGTPRPYYGEDGVG